MTDELSAIEESLPYRTLLQNYRDLTQAVRLIREAIEVRPDWSARPRTGKIAPFLGG